MAKRRIFSAGWWSRTETPRWVLASGAVFTVIANLGVSLYVDKNKREDDYRVEQIRLLLNDMASYQSVVAAFAGEATDKKEVSSSTRSALVKNLNDQFSHSREIEPLVPQDRERLENLRQDIGDLITALPEKYDAAEMTRFWNAVGKLTQVRNGLNKSLQNSI